MSDKRPDERVEFRVAPAELERWRQQAEHDGLTLSAWVRRACAPAKDDGGVSDPGSRVRAVLDQGIAAIERQMVALTTGKVDTKKSTQIVALTKDAATILGHIRRYDQAMREEAGRLSAAVVIAYLRKLREHEPDRFAAILGEAGGEVDDQEASVLA